MKLESAAYYSTTELELPLIIEKNELKTSEILKEVVNLYLDGHKKADIANAAQKTIANGLSELAIQSADKKQLAWQLGVFHQWRNGNQPPSDRSCRMAGRWFICPDRCTRFHARSYSIR